MSEEEANRAAELRLFAAGAQQRFEFYAVGLTFTLLAAAISTAEFGKGRVPDSLELLAWLALLLSGVAGLWRLSWHWIAHGLSARESELEASLRRIAEAVESGRELKFTRSGKRASAREALERFVPETENVVDQRRAAERKLLCAYRVASVTFVLGLCALVAARGYVPLLGILGLEEGTR